MEETILNIRCPGIENGRFLPDHTGWGKDLSPELILENLSPGGGGAHPSEQQYFRSV